MNVRQDGSPTVIETPAPANKIAWRSRMALAKSSITSVSLRPGPLGHNDQPPYAVQSAAAAVPISRGGGEVDRAKSSQRPSAERGPGARPPPPPAVRQLPGR